MKIILVILAIFIIFLIIFWNQIKMQLMVLTIIQRGLLTTNCRWWNISDKYLKDSSGVIMYNRLKEKDSFIPINFWGQSMYLVTDVNIIKIILDNSPNLFGVGKYKYNFFSSFMKDNVGVSEGCPWKKRRRLNEFVLNNGLYYSNFIKNINKLLIVPPKNFQEFSEIGKKLAGLIVFNQEKIPSCIFKIFSEANTIYSLFRKIKLPSQKCYINYIKQQLLNPRKNSLVNLGKIFGETDYEMIHQIPHWIFPLVGLPAVSIPRALVFICSSPLIYQKSIREIENNNLQYLRKCMLETFRLNNPIVTMFRTLMKDYCFSSECFTKGTQFAILTNPIMRGEDFINPNTFFPERWDSQLENKYSSLMFSQGPQKCPGKELALNISVNFLKVLLPKILFFYPKIDVNNVPQMINPCKIKFSYK